MNGHALPRTFRENPIVRSHARTAWRSFGKPLLGAAALFALAVIAAFYAESHDYTSDRITAWRMENAAEDLLGFLFMVQFAIASVGTIAAMLWTLTDEKRRGLFDLNLRSPMRPRDLAIGYLIGPALVPWSMAALAGASGWFIAVHVPELLVDWSLAQLLVATTAVVSASFSVLVGSGRNTLRGPLVGVSALGLALAASAMLPEFAAVHHLSGTVLIPEVMDALAGRSSPFSRTAWFGIETYAFDFTLAVQALGALGFFLGAMHSFRLRGTSIGPKFSVFVATSVAAVQLGFSAGAWDTIYQGLRSDPGRYRWNDMGQMGNVHLWFLLAVGGLGLLLAAFPSAERRFRANVRTQLTGFGRAFAEPYATAAALAALATVFMACVVSGIPTDIGQYGYLSDVPTLGDVLVAGASLWLSWTVLIAIFDTLQVRYGRRATSGFVLAICVWVLATVGLAIHFEEEAFHFLPMVTSFTFVAGGGGIESGALTGALGQVGLLSVALATRPRNAR